MLGHLMEGKERQSQTMDPWESGWMRVLLLNFILKTSIGGFFSPAGWEKICFTHIFTAPSLS